MSKIPLVAIVGPTASGKTAVAVALAHLCGGEIVSADSMQVYRGMEIGTAQPSMAERDGIPHHLMGILDPKESFSAAQFAALAHESIADIQRRNRTPILVGGSGLYVNAIIYDMGFDAVQSDPAIRGRLSQEWEEDSQSLRRKLMDVDPAYAAKIHENDARRTIRALEVYALTGRPFSSFAKDFRTLNSPYDLSLFGLTMDREILYDRINRRVDQMMDLGLLNEVRALFNQGISRESTAMQGLGYKELVNYLEGKCTLEEALETIKRESRRFAKRQLTWFRRDDRIRWLDGTKNVHENATWMYENL